MKFAPAVKIEAERKAGELLKVMEKHPGARAGKTPSHDATSLSELGIKRDQSSRWQRMADVPDKALAATA